MYYECYKKESFSNELISETKRLGLEPNKEQIDSYIEFINRRYSIKNVNLKVIIDKTKVSKSGGCYIDYKKEIRLYGTTSLITVLHEIRHYIQFNSSVKSIFKTYSDREEEARAWSSSLFYAIHPDVYLDYASKNKIKFI